MKKLIFILITLFIAFGAYCQTKYTLPYDTVIVKKPSGVGYLNASKGIYFDTLFLSKLQFRDGNQGAGKVMTSDASGNISLQSAATGGNPNSNVGSGFRWAIPNTNNIKTFLAGYGIIIDSATSNSLKLTVDTLSISTIAQLQHRIDSLGATIPGSSLFPTSGAGTATGDVTGDLGSHNLYITGSTSAVTVNLDDGTNTGVLSIDHGVNSTNIGWLKDDATDGSVITFGTDAIMNILGSGTFKGGPADSTNYIGESYVQKDWTLDHIGTAIHDSIAYVSDSTYGTFSNTVFTNSLTSNWQNVNATYALNGGLHIRGGDGGAKTNYLKGTQNTASNNYSVIIDFRVDTLPTGVTQGVTFGKISQNGVANFDLGVKYEYAGVSSARALLLLSTAGNSYHAVDSTNAITMSKGYYRIYIIGSNNSIFYKIAKVDSSLTGYNDEIESQEGIYYFNYNVAPTTITGAIPNTNSTWISCQGGAYTVKQYNEQHYNLVRPQVVFLGTSLFTRNYSSFINNFFIPNIMQETRLKWTILAGGGDVLVNLLDRITEVLYIRPKYCLIDLAYNTQGSVTTYLRTLLDTLINNGITPIAIKTGTNTNVDTAINNACTSRNVQIVEVYKYLTANDFVNEGVHWSDQGQFHVGNLIKGAIPSIFNNTPVIAHPLNDTLLRVLGAVTTTVDQANIAGKKFFTSNVKLNSNTFIGSSTDSLAGNNALQLAPNSGDFGMTISGKADGTSKTSINMWKDGFTSFKIFSMGYWDEPNGTLGNDFVFNIYNAGWRDVIRFNSSNNLILLNTGGNLGVSVATPTARLMLPAGTAATSTAPLKFTSGTNLTTAEAGTEEFNGSFYQTKTSALRYALGGVIADFTTDVNNSGTGETDLYSYTTPASTLASNGEKIVFNYTVNLSDITATAQIKIYFAGTVVGNTGALTVSATGAVIVTGWIIRTGSTTARASVNISSPTASTAVYTAETDLTSLTLSGTNILKITGQAGGAGGGSNDITSKAGTVSWFGAASN